MFSGPYPAFALRVEPFRLAPDGLQSGVKDRNMSVDDAKAKTTAAERFELESLRRMTMSERFEEWKAQQYEMLNSKWSRIYDGTRARSDGKLR